MVVAFALLTALLLSRAGTVGAQAPASLQIVALIAGGKLYPTEQFRVDTGPGCPRDPAQPRRTYFRTRSGGPAIALDNSELADPAPSGCGFGTVETGLPESAQVATVTATRATVEAWTARTGILVLPAATASPALPADGAVPAAPYRVAPLTTALRVLFIATIALAAGVATSAVVYVRERSARARLEAHARGSAPPAPDRHLGMLIEPDLPAPPRIDDGEDDEYSPGDDPAEDADGASGAPQEIAGVPPGEVDRPDATRP